MLTTLYKLFLHLYPVQCRSSFGNEMVSVFRQAHADARRKHMGHRIAFCVREFSGLIGDAFLGTNADGSVMPGALGLVT